MANPFYQSKEWKTARAKALAVNKRSNGGILRCCVCSQQILDRPNVDHVKRLRDYPELAYDVRNLEVLHQSCHSKTKQLIEANANKPVIGLDGLPDEWR
jgi:5-methylcytosine-specific restriction endonuclease McrA